MHCITWQCPLAHVDAWAHMEPWPCLTHKCHALPGVDTPSRTVSTKAATMTSAGASSASILSGRSLMAWSLTFSDCECPCCLPALLLIRMMELPQLVCPMVARPHSAGHMQLL